MRIIKLEDRKVDLLALQKDCLHLLEKYPVREERQICLTHRPEVIDLEKRLYEGAGGLRSKFGEFEFSKINEELNGLYVYDYLKELASRRKLGRTRIMVLPPRVCYSMHRDWSMYRFHVALQTNKHAYIIYESGEMYHIPSDGHVYKMETHPIHSAFNGGNSDRIHLVMEVGVKET